MISIIKPSVQIIDQLIGIDILEKIELAGRVCYKSEDRITENSCLRFVRTLIHNGHESVLEHVSITVKIICSRSASHQLVRHRISKITDDGIINQDIADTAISQESMRYVNYNKSGALEVICPPSIQNSLLFEDWKRNTERDYKFYNELINNGIKPEDARESLPISTKTEMFMTNNLRQWRTVFKERTGKSAQWQIRSLMIEVLNEFKSKIPVIFDDIIPYYEETITTKA